MFFQPDLNISLCMSNICHITILAIYSVNTQFPIAWFFFSGIALINVLILHLFWTAIGMLYLIKVFFWIFCYKLDFIQQNIMSFKLEKWVRFSQNIWMSTGPHVWSWILSYRYLSTPNPTSSLIRNAGLSPSYTKLIFFPFS